MIIQFKKTSQLIRSFAMALIRLYQRCISPALGPRCRFYPSCSEYARLCIENKGILIGTARSVVRICKCHQWHPGGVDLPKLD